MTSGEPTVIGSLEARFSRLPRMLQLILAAVFWPISIVYGLYYLWSRELYALSARIMITVVAVLFLASILFADFFPDREQPAEQPAAEQSR
jgi:hypothetical protein